MIADPEKGRRARPFLKWAGSKRWLVQRLVEAIPADFGAYHEPFLGSGAVFFGIRNNSRHHFLGDSLEPLINCFKQVHDGPHEVARLANAPGTDRETYYKLRAADEPGDLQRAARFIYFNQLCFNGLYRENLRGHFNVPYGRPRLVAPIADPDELELASAALSTNVTIRHQDFEQSLQDVATGDLVYLDPPYISGHKDNGFVDYNARVFSWGDQERLREFVNELDKVGAQFIMSNADHGSIRDLYKGYGIAETSRFSSMSSRPGTRRRADELVITNIDVSVAL